MPARPYAATSPWNTPIPANVTVHPDSAKHIARLKAAPPLTSDTAQYSIGVWPVSASTPGVTVKFSGYFSDCYQTGERIGTGEAPTISGIPIPAALTVSPGTDGQVVLLDEARGIEWGLWQVKKQADGSITATNGYVARCGPDWMGRFLGVPDANGVRGVSKSGRGAGTPYYSGLVMAAEAKAGKVEHALSFAYNWPTKTVYTYPASKTDGLGSAATGGIAMTAAMLDLPEGTRVQLDPAATEAEMRGWGLGDTGIVIAKALQQYGMYVVDNSGRPKVYLEDSTTTDWSWLTDPSALAEKDRAQAAGETPKWTEKLLSGIPWDRFRTVVAPDVVEQPALAPKSAPYTLGAVGGTTPPPSGSGSGTPSTPTLPTSTDYRRVYWTGVRDDGRPSTGKVTLTYDGGKRRDDRVTIHPSPVTRELEERYILDSTGLPRLVGYAEWLVLATDSNRRGSGCTYTVTEEIDGNSPSTWSTNVPKGDGETWLDPLNAVPPRKAP